MKSKISQILQDIDIKKEELKQAYRDLMDKHDFKLLNWKIKFSKSAILKNRKFKKPFSKDIFFPKIRHLISMPFIYAMLIPVIILDIFLFMYQKISFPLYGIPQVKRRNYIVFDRQILTYLNWFEKLNCIYCSYANGIFSFAVEIAWRTEKYRCPIKHAKKQAWWHEWEKFFADYGDAEEFRKVFNKVKCFKK